MDMILASQPNNVELASRPFVFDDAVATLS